MPIRHMASQNQESYETGAFSPLDGQINNNSLCLFDTHHGLCLSAREQNGYEDSDFFMTVWNEEKGEPEEIKYATTRGWTYPCFYSHVDATDEVKAKYEAWKQEQEKKEAKRKRTERAKMLLKLRNMERKVVETHNVSSKTLISLRKEFGGIDATGKGCDDYSAIIAFATNKRIRNNFKLNIQQQIVSWMRGEGSNYPRPLSPRQMSFI